MWVCILLTWHLFLISIIYSKTLDNTYNLTTEPDTAYYSVKLRNDTNTASISNFF